MTTNLFKLGSNDIIKSIITAVFAAVVVAIGGIVTQPGFDVFTVDWASVLKLVVNVSISVLLGDISRRFMTDDNGKLLGRIG